jgi:predicted lipoprotein with Yx(FWY)xxD motif
MVFRLSAGSLVATALAVAFATAAFAGGAVAFTMKSAKNTALGTTIVVSATGKTLYHYADDRKNTVKCTGSCAATWPPLLIAAGKKPVAGAGLTASKLGTVKRPDGKTQVTYGGYPLYLFSGDAKAGDVNGQGLEGEWHAVAPTGALVTKSASAASGSTSSGYGTATTTTTTTSGGGGYGY